MDVNVYVITDNVNINTGVVINCTSLIDVDSLTFDNVVHILLKYICITRDVYFTYTYVLHTLFFRNAGNLYISMPELYFVAL